MRIIDLLLITCLVFITLSFSHAQDGGIYKKGKRDPSEKLNKRWVFYPKFQPYYPVLTSFKNLENETIEVKEENGLMVGMVFEKFYPNRNLGYKIDFDYTARDLIFPGSPTFYLSENNIGLTPILQLKKNKLLKEKIPLFELGLRTQYTLSSILVATDQNLALEVDNFDLLRNIRWYGYVGIGIENILSNVELGKTRYVGLKHFSVGMYFPLFNQANLFKSDKPNFEAPYDVFFKSRFSHFYFNINFAHALDLKRNLVSYTMPAEVYGNCSKDAQPFINWSNPKKNLFSNFYFHALIQPRVDSIVIDYIGDNQFITDVSPAPVSYRLGYTLHFLGNYKKHINTTTCLEYNANTADYKILRFNFFVSTGVSNRTFFIENGLSRTNLFDAEALGGVRFGLHPFGIFAFGGYAYQINLSKELSLRDKFFDDFNFSNLGNSYWFGGLSYKNLLSFRVNYHPGFTNEKVVSSILDKMSFSIGIGI